jgi:uncharacterized protein
MGQSKAGLKFGPLPKVPKGMKCPICKAPAEATLKPFCSSRCADVDLSRWISGAYAIPGGDADADEDGDSTHASQRPGEPAAGDDEHG